MIGLGSVRGVDACDIHALANHLIEERRIIGSGPHRRHDFGAS
jgi:hypothetical protein